MNLNFFRNLFLRSDNIIVCKGCGYEIDLNIIPEEKMGYTRCPNCKKLVNNNGDVVEENKNV